MAFLSGVVLQNIALFSKIKKWLFKIYQRCGLSDFATMF